MFKMNAKKRKTFKRIVAATVAVFLVCLCTFLGTRGNPVTEAYGCVKQERVLDIVGVEYRTAWVMTKSGVVVLDQPRPEVKDGSMICTQYGYTKERKK